MDNKETRYNWSQIMAILLLCSIITYLFIDHIGLRKEVQRANLILSDLYSEHETFADNATNLIHIMDKDINELKNEISYFYKEVEGTCMSKETSELVFDRPYSSEILKVCSNYDFVDDLPFLISAMVEVESNFQPNTISSAGCVGLMQVSPYWQKERIEKFAIEDIYDPYSNILVGVDFLEDLYYNYANYDIVLAVMMYNMDFISAKNIYYSGRWSKYAIDVFDIFNSIKPD